MKSTKQCLNVQEAFDKTCFDDIILCAYKNMNTDNLTGSEAKNLPLTLVLNSFRPYIEQKVAGLKVPGTDRDDLCQEAYVALLAAIGSYDEQKGTSFSTYAIACINNRLTDAVKTANRRKNRVLNDSVSLTDDSNPIEIISYESPEEVTLNQEDYHRLMQRIENELSKKEQKVLMLWVDGYDYEEIARILDIPVKSVDNALQRARRKLKK